MLTYMEISSNWEHTWQYTYVCACCYCYHRHQGTSWLYTNDQDIHYMWLLDLWVVKYDMYSYGTVLNCS